MDSPISHLQFIDDFTFRSDISETLNNLLKKKSVSIGREKFVGFSNIVNLIADGSTKDRIRWVKYNEIKEGKYKYQNLIRSIRSRYRIGLADAQTILKGFFFDDIQRFSEYMYTLESNLVDFVMDGSDLELYVSENENKTLNSITVRSLLKLLHTPENGFNYEHKTNLMRSAKKKQTLDEGLGEKLILDSDDEYKPLYTFSKDVKVFLFDYIRSEFRETLPVWKDISRNLLEFNEELTKKRAIPPLDIDKETSKNLRDYVLIHKSEGYDMIPALELVKLFYPEQSGFIFPRMSDLRRRFKGGQFELLEGKIQNFPYGQRQRLSVHTDSVEKFLSHLVTNLNKYDLDQMIMNINERIPSLRVKHAHLFQDTGSDGGVFALEKYLDYHSCPVTQCVPVINLVQLFYPLGKKSTAPNYRTHQLKQKYLNGELARFADDMCSDDGSRRSKLEIGRSAATNFIQYLKEELNSKYLEQFETNLNVLGGQIVPQNKGRKAGKRGKVVKKYNEVDRKEYIMEKFSILPERELKSVLDNIQKIATDKSGIFLLQSAMAIYLSSDTETRSFLANKESVNYVANRLDISKRYASNLVRDVKSTRIVATRDLISKIDLEKIVKSHPEDTVFKPKKEKQPEKSFSQSTSSIPSYARKQPDEYTGLCSYIDHIIFERTGNVPVVKLVSLFYSSDSKTQAPKFRATSLKKKYKDGGLEQFKDYLSVRNPGTRERLEIKPERAVDFIRYLYETLQAKYREQFMINMKEIDEDSITLFDASLRVDNSPKSISKELPRSIEMYLRGKFFILPKDELDQMLKSIDATKRLSEGFTLLNNTLEIYLSNDSNKRSHLAKREALRYLSDNLNVSHTEANVLIPKTVCQTIVTQKILISKNNLDSIIADYKMRGRKSRSTFASKPTRSGANIPDNVLNLKSARNFISTINPYISIEMVEDILGRTNHKLKGGSKYFTEGSLIESYLKMDERYHNELSMLEQYPLNLGTIIEYLDRPLIYDSVPESFYNDEKSFLISKYVDHIVGEEYKWGHRNQVRFCRSTFNVLGDFLKTDINRIPEYQPPAWMCDGIEYTDFKGAVDFLNIHMSEFTKYMSRLDSRDIQTFTGYPLHELIEIKNRELRISS